MYLFLSDETNTTQNDAVRFLIFGALLIPMENAVGAVEGVLRIRKRAGYPQVRNSSCQRGSRNPRPPGAPAFRRRYSA